jgi:two-component system OmpR family sensor kinase
MVSRRRVLSRLPIRVRLTIAFVAVMAAVLAAAGVFLYAQSRSDLDAQIDAALQSDADDVEALLNIGRPAAIVASGVGLAQVYDAHGRIVASSLKARQLRLLTTAEAARALHQPQRVDRRPLPSGAARIRAIPARASDGTLGAVAVAEPLALRDHELSRLRKLLLMAGPFALLLASVAAYEVARAALRPVNRMRTRAERITEHELSERLPVADSGDEIASLGRTLNAMLDRFEAAVERERRLVGDASHELRTPLTTLRAEVDFALRRDRSPEELRAALESAAEEARRMTRLADDLLVLARADQGRLPLHPEPLAPRELLEAAAARSGAAADMSGRAIVVRDELAADSMVSADADRSAQVLDNLVTNALRYGEGTITLTARDDGEVVELHVMDEGPGFPDTLLEHAFERFARGSEARANEPGSGLGLALVQAVADAHGGFAKARNRPEGGADVWIGLPRGQAERSR